ncbi:MAG: MFS transporter [Bacteroidales bacterium]|jgi:FHS family L-fucose permease-like MFS transporter|nr:MFS transporter [Bacteroidales bacterium]MBR3541213.1 MFS transporter [Bacteroidales bacterium]
MAQKQERNWVAIITMFFIFGMISFVTNMAAPFGNIWGFKYEWAGMAGNLMNFLAYLFMGIPAGNMLIKFGYKKTALIALAVGFIGLGIQWLSSKVGADVAVCEIAGQICSLNLFIYLLGALVCGFCVCMLNTVVNPMLNLLGGGGNSGNQLIQAGGTINSLTGTLTPMLVGVLIGTLTKNTTMAEVSPLVIAGMVIFAVSFCIISFVKIEEPQGDLSNVTYERSPLAFRHCLLGIIAIFFYVGIEIGVPNEMNMWISRLPFEGAAAVAGSLAAAYWFLMLCGRFLSTIISGKVSTRTQMITVSSVAILLLLCAIFTGNINISLFGGEVPLSCLFIFLCGLCTSIMWGGIFNLSTEGLGKYTAKASGLFMTMVVGGGVMPFIQDNLVRPVTGYLGSYWLIIAMIAYILFYSLWGSKNVNKDIKVD